LASFVDFCATLRAFAGQLFAERAIDLLPALWVLGVSNKKIGNGIADFGGNGSLHGGACFITHRAF
jgi:hypothetical protein